MDITMLQYALIGVFFVWAVIASLWACRVNKQLEHLEKKTESIIVD